MSSETCSKTAGGFQSGAPWAVAWRVPFLTEKTNGLPSENQVPRTPARSAGTEVPGVQAVGGCGVVLEDLDEQVGGDRGGVGGRGGVHQRDAGGTGRAVHEAAGDVAGHAAGVADEDAFAEAEQHEAETEPELPAVHVRHDLRLAHLLDRVLGEHLVDRVGDERSSTWPGRSQYWRGRRRRPSRRGRAVARRPVRRRTAARSTRSRPARRPSRPWCGSSPAAAGSAPGRLVPGPSVEPGDDLAEHRVDQVRVVEPVVRLADPLGVVPAGDELARGPGTSSGPRHRRRARAACR